MSRIVVAAASCIAVLGLTAAPAGAVTVSSNTTMNCEDGEGRPDGMGFDSGSKRFTAPFLTVNSDARLSLRGAETPSACSLAITGDTAIAGTLDYDQGGSMGRAGHLVLLSGGKTSVPGTISADGASRLLSGDGGDGGFIVIRSNDLSITGTISARGGDGADATGDDGGDAGDITVIGDRSASISGATFVSAPGAGGAGAPPLIAEGSPGTDRGTVRRNARTGATGGTATAFNTPVNQAPTNFTVARSGSDKVLRWQDRSQEESGFVVLRRIGNGPVEFIRTTSPNTVSFTDSTALPAGSTTLYAVFPTFPASVWPGAFAVSNVGTVEMPSASDGDSPSSSPTPPPSTDATSGQTPATTPVGVAIRRALRSGRRLAVTGTVDRRLAGERVELLVGTGSRLLGRVGLRVSRTGRVAVSGTMPARMARTRSLLVAIRTPSTSRLRREMQIARVARMSPALRATSGSRGRGRLTVSGRARKGLRGRIVLSVRYVDETGSIRSVRHVARHRGSRWIARVDMPATARQGVITIATRGDLRHHGQGLVARLPGS